MDPRVKSEEEIFEEALGIEDDSERWSFVEKQCGDDTAMRDRLNELLGVSQDAEGFFESSSEMVSRSELYGRVKSVADSAASGSRPDDPIFSNKGGGLRIGRYKLLRRLGDGGCGVVYLAEQEKPVRRPVALKIIRVGMESGNLIARFEAERQALAMMDHPNIARVFDAGETEAGSPYFVMEHVRGMRITDYCNHHKLRVRERLDLFIQVCHAIQHAHQKGVIHGDIKPSNLLVAQHDGVPVPKVIDFGISRATESQLNELMGESGSNQLFGTPAYMSPEQVDMGGLDVDTRSDIYSLGVLLYELLTGSAPFDGNMLMEMGLEEMRRVLKEFKPMSPTDKLLSYDEGKQNDTARLRGLTRRRLLNRLKGDLDSIVLKALEKDRRQRYETADAMAMDIQRHLSHEPVIAHSSAWLYTSRKMVRRNRGVFLASTAVGLALVFGMGMSTVLFLREREARQRAVQAEQQQSKLRLEAEVREKMTQAALMVSQDRHAEADSLLSGIKLTQSSVEGASVFRSLGEWHALNHRWKQAAERFKVLLQINEFEGGDVSTLDYLEMGPVLIELGDLVAYESFRQSAIDRFAGTRSPYADRIVKVCLLAPASDRVIDALTPFADQTKEACENADRNGNSFEAAWRSMSIALFEYRKGDLGSAEEWARRCLNYPGTNSPRSATAQLVLSLSLYRMGEEAEAKQHLEQARALVESKTRPTDGRGTPVLGFWFDWAFARIILKEASSQIL